MKKVGGIELTLSSFEHGLWWDTDKDLRQVQEHESGFGIKLALVWGMLLRPIGPFWRPGYYRGEYGRPWAGGKVAFVLRIPFIVGPYISIAFGRKGLYAGLKTYGVDKGDTHYASWINPKDVPKEGENRYLCLSFSTRNTRWR